MKEVIKNMLKEKKENIRVVFYNANKSSCFPLRELKQWEREMNYEKKKKNLIDARKLLKEDNIASIQIFDEKEKLWYEVYGFVIPAGIFKKEKINWWKR